jgi:aryl-alcohol dehydrogenase-like predicted oxidoreductase
MDYRRLGKTGLNVSRLSLGTAELGLDYGIRQSGKSNLMTKKEALGILRYALDNGINFFDTAPVYGRSEALLGEVIGKQKDCYIATKVPIFSSGRRLLTGKTLEQKLDNSINRSLRTLKRQTLDIVQIHNATVETMKQDAVTGILLKNQQSGKIRFVGVSVYGEENALFAMKMGCFDIIQVAYSLLDQRMAKDIFPIAKELGVGIINRSVLLKGALTPRAKWLPDKLLSLRQASEKIIKNFAISWDTLPQLACRFCLSCKFIHTVLIGTKNKKEIKDAINAYSDGPLGNKELEIAKGLGLDDEKLLNPYYWPMP